MAYDVVVSSKGQIVIPREIREQLHIEEGTSLLVEVRGADIVFTAPRDWRLLRGSYAKTGLTTTDLLEVRKEDLELED